MAIDRGRETLIGAVTLGVLVLLLWTNAADKDEIGEDAAGYSLEAVFQRTDGLTAGAQVRMAGMAVGRVVGQTLDDSFRAHVAMRIDSGIDIPTDSAAVIETDGLLGGKYIEIQPGGMEEMLQPGSRIDYTQGSVMIEELLARIVAQAKARRASGDAATPRDDGPAAGSGADEGADGGSGDSPFPSLLDPMGTGQ